MRLVFIEQLLLLAQECTHKHSPAHTHQRKKHTATAAGGMDCNTTQSVTGPSQHDCIMWSAATWKQHSPATRTTLRPQPHHSTAEATGWTSHP